MKLKYREIATHRSALLQKQHNRCALCDQLIVDDAVLDHDHKSGLIRAVLHRGCNAMLGKIENNMPRNRIDIHRLTQFSTNLVKYITAQYEDIVHPTRCGVKKRVKRSRKI